ncbi:MULTISPECIES: HNH endonuclease [Psychrilyobacter]|nr:MULTISPECIES: hypothetical protein [Psychrilyobacter]NDI78476.1 hypothetical protein [Psychrilyobacter piezotolerans]
MNDSKTEILKKAYWKYFKEKKLENWKDKILQSENMTLLFIKIVEVLVLEIFYSTEGIDEAKLEKVIEKLVCIEKNDLKKLINIIERKISRNKKSKKIEYALGSSNLEDNADKISDFFLEQYTNFQQTVFMTDNVRDYFLTCPYCNATYLFDLKQRSKRGGESGNSDYFADQLDHYYPKSKYPYLAMSIFNLIPSCPTCNHIKGNKENHLHPHFEEMGDNAKFTLSMSCLGELTGIEFENMKEYKELESDLGTYVSLNFDLEEGFKKRVELKIKKDIDSELKERIENSKKIFQLENKYSGVKDEIRDLYFKHKLLSQSQREETLSQFGDSLGITPEEMEEVYFGARKTEEHKRPLSKFINDIRDFLDGDDQDGFE